MAKRNLLLEYSEELTVSIVKLCNENKLDSTTKAIDEITFKKLRNLCGRIKRLLTSSCITIENKLKQG